MSPRLFPAPPAAAFRPALFALVGALLLAGCALTRVTDPASRYYDLPAESTFTLRQDVEIPPGRARVALQYGRAGTATALQRYETYCEIEVNEVSATPAQIVRAGPFTVTQVWRRQEIGVVERPFLLAANGAGIGFDLGIGVGLGGGFGLGFGTRISDSGRDGGSLLVLNVIHMRLHSPAQPQVRELYCTAGWAHQGEAVYPTLAEIRAALGDVASIDIGQ